MRVATLVEACKVLRGEPGRRVEDGRVEHVHPPWPTALHALSDAEPVLLGASAASLLLLLAVAVASSLPAVHAFCMQTAAGVVVLHGTMVWVLPALLQLRWQQRR